MLPLGFGIVTGILLLNSYGRYFARRRVIEGGMIALGVLLGALSAAGPISRLLQRADAPGGPDLSIVTSLLSVVVVIAFFAGMAYGLVAIPAQTQLQEDLPEDVRGRVFGILMMVVSVASFLPIIIIAPISDVIGTTAVIFILAIAVLVTGVAVRRDAGSAAGIGGTAGERPAARRPDRDCAREADRRGPAAPGTWRPTATVRLVARRRERRP